jgi:hypothetical protein
MSSPTADSAHPAPLRRVSAAVYLAAIVALALGLRAAVLAEPDRIVSRDGIRYAKIARALAEGRVEEALANDYAPGFPAAAALAGRALGARSDRDFARAAALASVLFGGLAAVPAYLLARRAAGAGAGLFAALALALHPRHVEISADALSEPLACLGALAALAAGLAASGAGPPLEPDRRPDARDAAPCPGVPGAPLRSGLGADPPPGHGPLRAAALAALSGALAAGAGLARPEAILAGLAPLAAPGRRALRAAALLAALLAAAAPYAARASADAGRPALSKKKDAAALLEGALERPAEVARSAARTLGRTPESAQAVLLLSLAGLALGLRRGGPARALALGTGGACGLLLLAQSLVRSDPRFALVLTVTAAPLAGLALEEARLRLARRPAFAAPGRAGAALAAALVLATAPGILLVTRPDKPHYAACARAVGAACAAEGLAAPAVLAPDARIAHLAGDERALDALGRERLPYPEGAASVDVLVRFDADPPPPGLRLRPLGAFAPPAGSRARALVAERVVGAAPAGAPAPPPPGP